MAIKWKITKTNPDQGCIEVLWSDIEEGIEIGPLNISIPLINGQYPSGVDLKKIIDGYTPFGEIDRLKLIKASKDIATMSHIDSMIGVENIANLNVFVTTTKVVQVDPIAELSTVKVV